MSTMAEASDRTVVTVVAPAASVVTTEVERGGRVRDSGGVPSVVDWCVVASAVLGGVVADLVDVELEHLLSKDEELLERIGGSDTCAGVDEFVAARDVALKDVGFDLWLLADSDDVNVRNDREAIAHREAHAVLGPDNREEDLDVGSNQMLVKVMA